MGVALRLAGRSNLTRSNRVHQRRRSNKLINQPMRANGRYSFSPETSASVLRKALITTINSLTQIFTE
jgi:hypothetical protein